MSNQVSIVKYYFIFSIVLIVFVVLGAIVIVSLLLLGMWYLSGRQNLFRWAGELKRISEVVRFTDEEKARFKKLGFTNFSFQSRSVYMWSSAFKGHVKNDK